MDYSTINDYWVSTRRCQSTAYHEPLIHSSHGEWLKRDEYRCIVQGFSSCTMNITYFPSLNPSRFMAFHHFTIVYTTNGILNP